MLPDQNNDELKDAALLKTMQPTEPFKAPEGYFESLSGKIQDKIAANPGTIPTKIFLFRPAFAIAAVLIVCLAGGLFFNLHKGITPQNEVACTYDDVIESGYYSELDENLLAEKLVSTSASKTNDDKDIEDYLINNSDELLLTDTF